MQWVERTVTGSLTFRFPRTNTPLNAPNIYIGGTVRYTAGVSIVVEGDDWAWTVPASINATQITTSFPVAVCYAGPNSTTELYRENIALFQPGNRALLREDETFTVRWATPLPIGSGLTGIYLERWISGVNFEPERHFHTVREADSGSNANWAFTISPVAQNLPPGAYRYRFMSRNSAGSAVYSPYGAIVVEEAVAPDPLSVTISGPSSGMVGDTLNFAATSNDPVASFEWAFGDGGTSTQKNPTHVYVSAGTFTVTVTARNADDETASDSLQITVGDIPKPPPTVAITGPSSGLVGKELQFSATGTGENLTYAWDFGDGGAASGATAKHIFASAGTYAVSVVVTDGSGATAISTTTVAISDPIIPPEPPEPPGLRSAPCFFESGGEYSGVPGSQMGQILHTESASLKASVAAGARVGDLVTIRELIAPDTPTWSRRYRIQQIIPDGAMTTLILQRGE